MTFQFVFTPKAEKDLANLPQNIARQIASKLIFLSKQLSPLTYAKKLKSPLTGYRFRIGNYRVIFDIDQKGNLTILMILRIAHRKKIYK